MTTTGACELVSMNSCRSAGYVGIDRHVRAARLQDPEQPDEHVQRALDADPDQCLPADTEFAEVPPEPVRARLQLSVRETLALVDDRDRIRGLPRPIGDQLVDAP